MGLIAKISQYFVRHLSFSQVTIQQANIIFALLRNEMSCSRFLGCEFSPLISLFYGSIFFSAVSFPGKGKRFHGCSYEIC